MNPLRRHPALSTLLSPFRRSQQKTCAALVAALCQAAQASSSAVAGQLACLTGVQLCSALTRLYRSLRNERFDNWLLTEQMLRLLGGRSGPLLLALDWTAWQDHFSLLTASVCATRDIAGARVVTEGGTLLGQVANVYVHLAPPPLAAYEVRESLPDKLLGRGLFIPASLGRALSDDAERIIVPEDTSRTAAASLEELAGGPLAALIEDETVVRRRGEEGLAEGSKP